MVIPILDRLTSDDFYLSVAGLSTSTVLRRFLARSSEVAAVREGLRQGAFIEDALRAFVSGLLSTFQWGHRFINELALAALAVAVESRGTDFADEYLRDLSQLRVAELALATRVAAECIKQRWGVSATHSKAWNLLEE